MQFKGSSAVLCLILFFIGGSNALSCATSTLPVVPNSSNDASSATTVPDGTMVTFTCDTNYRIAPADDPAILSMTQAVMCEANGAFDPSSFSCVPMNPSSCEDFYSRAKMFTDLADECQVVTIDPNGPSVEPAAIAGARCCKNSNTEIETRIGVSTDTRERARQLGPCTNTGLFTNVMPSTSFIGPVSRFCDDAKVVYEVASAYDDVEAIINTTSGGCSQNVAVRCEGSTNMAPAIRYNTEASGILYGTSEFPNRGTDINLDHYTYTSGGCGTTTCDCAGVPGAAEMDRVTRTDISATNPAFVTYFGATQHASTAVAATMQYDILVRAIRCKQPAP